MGHRLKNQMKEKIKRTNLKVHKMRVFRLEDDFTEAYV